MALDHGGPVRQVFVMIRQTSRDLFLSVGGGCISPKEMFLTSADVYANSGPSSDER